MNGDIEAFTDDPKELIDELVAIHTVRRGKYIRRIVFDFQEFLRFIFMNVSGVLFSCTSQFPSRGVDGGAALPRTCAACIPWLCTPPSRTSSPTSTSRPAW